MRRKSINNEDNLLTSVTMLHGIGENNRQSWEQFYARYSGVILGVARQMGLDENSAWDVLQEVMLDFDRVSGRFSYDSTKRVFLVSPQNAGVKPPEQVLGGFRQWLFMVVKRKVWKHQKRRRHITFTEWSQDSGRSPQDVRDASPTADRLLEEKSERSYRIALLEEALRLLPGTTKRSNPRKLAIFLALKLHHLLDSAIAEGSTLPEIYHAEIHGLRDLRLRLGRSQLLKEDLMRHYAMSGNHIDQEVKAIKDKLQELVAELAAGKAS